MRELLERLREGPWDPASWQVLADLILDRGPAVQEPALLDEIEALFRGTLHFDGGYLWRMQARSGGWEGSPAGYAALEVYEGAEPSQELRAIAAQAMGCLELPGEVTLDGLRVYRWLRVVELEQDPLRECSLSRAQELSGSTDFALDEEIGLLLPFESRLVALALLLALRQARPLRSVPPPDPDLLLEELLAEEAMRSDVPPGEIVQQIEARLYASSDHAPSRHLTLDHAPDGLHLVLPVRTSDAPGPGECLASEVGLPADTLVAFERGPLAPEQVRSMLARACLHGASMRERLLHQDELALALVRRLRRDRPLVRPSWVTGQARRLDYYAVLTRLQALSEPGRDEAALALAQRLIDRLDPAHQELARQGLARSVDAVCALIEDDQQDLATLLLFLGGRAFAVPWGGGPVTLAQLASIFAFHEPSEG